MRTYFDTSVLVAACVGRHVHHVQAVDALRQVRSGILKGIVSSHGLTESFAVLTRAPFVPPILPHEAWLYLSTNVLPIFEQVTLTAIEYREVLERCSQNGWSGGRVYDALHVQAAKSAKAERVYTFDLRHFLQVGPDIRNIVVSP